jgi:predicted nucleic acid-binding protein
MDAEIILFDTDATIDFLRESPLIMEYAHSIGTESMFINPIVLAEVLYKSVDKADLARIKKKVAQLPSVPFSVEISDIFEIEWEKYILSHRPAIPDMMIAATCLYYDIPLFTFNKKDFTYITGLRVIEHDIKPMPRKGGSWFF